MLTPSPEDEDDRQNEGRPNSPELFSSPRMPERSPWRLLLLGIAGVSASFLFQLLFSSDRTMWLALGGVYLTIFLARLVLSPYGSTLRRKLRVRRATRKMSPVVAAVFERWSEIEILSRRRASRSDLSRFERQYGVVLPSDLSEYFAVVNGTTNGEHGRDDEYDVGFWHLDQVRTFAETHVGDDPDDRVTFAFADCHLRFGVYGVQLSADPNAPAPIVVRLPYGRFQVAESFSAFLLRYVLNDTTVLFPEYSVVADDHGIGAESNGVTSYVLRWAEVHTISIEIRSDDDAPDGAFPIWCITGLGDRRPFMAPVDTVGGGRILRKRIRRLPGFDEAEYLRARQAEEQGTSGTFVVWRHEPSPGLA